MSVAKMRMASPKRVTIVMNASRSSGDAGRRAGSASGSGAGGGADGGVDGASDDAVIGSGSLGARRRVGLDLGQSGVRESRCEPARCPGKPIGK